MASGAAGGYLFPEGKGTWRRTWRERLFSRPWRPWVATEEVDFREAVMRRLRDQPAILERAKVLPLRPPPAPVLNQDGTPMTLCGFPVREMPDPVVASDPVVFGGLEDSALLTRRTVRLTKGGETVAILGELEGDAVRWYPEADEYLLGSRSDLEDLFG